MAQCRIAFMKPLISFAAIAGAAIAGFGGCSQKPKILPIPEGREVVLGSREELDRIKAAPEKFLRASLRATQAIRQFTLEFQRQERLGLLKSLQLPENIYAEFRNEPFSVRFTWRDPDAAYRQCAYVEGQHSNRVLVLRRKGLLGLPPLVEQYDPNLAVSFSVSRNPITDFGPRRMIERTVDRIEKARALGEVSISLHGAAEIGPFKEQCVHIEIRYPEKDEFPCKLQDLYISPQTLLPVAVYLWLPGEIERCDETLDALYLYAGLNPNVNLTDENFIIDKNMNPPPLRNRLGEEDAEGRDDETSSKTARAATSRPAQSQTTESQPADSQPASSQPASTEADVTPAASSSQPAPPPPLP